MPYPRNTIVAVIDSHAQVTKNLSLAKERQSFQANKRRRQPPRWKIGQKLILSSQNMNLPNDNKKMKPMWVGPYSITQVNYQCNNYKLDFTSNSDVCHIYKTLHIGRLKPCRETNQPELAHRYYTKSGPMKDVRYEVEKAVNFRFRQPRREALYQIRWKGHLPSQNQVIHSDEIDDDV